MGRPARAGSVAARPAARTASTAQPRAPGWRPFALPRRSRRPILHFPGGAFPPGRPQKGLRQSPDATASEPRGWSLSSRAGPLPAADWRRVGRAGDVGGRRKPAPRSEVTPSSRSDARLAREWNTVDRCSSRGPPWKRRGRDVEGEARLSVYVVAQGRIENREMLNRYVGKAIPTIQASGGRILGFDESPEIVEGEVEHPRTVILAFPSREAFRAWYNSDAYQAILPLRLKSTPGTLIVVSGLPRS